MLVIPALGRRKQGESEVPGHPLLHKECSCLFYFVASFSTLFHPFNPLTGEKKRTEGKGGW